MTGEDYQEHDISDAVWVLLEPILPGQRGQWGGVAEDNRRFINGVLWIIRTGAPWRDLPAEYGKWGTVHQRFIRWRRNGIWEKILEVLIQDPDYEWLMIDAGHAAAQSAPMGEKMVAQLAHEGSSSKYIWPWMRMICQSEVLLQKVPQMVSVRCQFD